MKINRKEYRVPELDFNAICELEQNGIDILNLMSGNTGNMKLANTLRGIVAWIMGCDLDTAGRELQLHIMSGGTTDDLIEGLTEAVEKAGFGKEEPAKVVPRDYQKKKNNKKKHHTKPSQNSYTGYGSQKPY